MNTKPTSFRTFITAPLIALFCAGVSSASANGLDGIYVDVSGVYSNIGEGRIVERTEFVETLVRIPPTLGNPPLFVPIVDAVTTYELDQSAQNPYGRFAVGYSLDFSPELRAYLDFSYQKSFDADDKPRKQIALGLTWRPFRR